MPTETTDVLAPASRHNLHVTGRSDLVDVGPWSRDQLWGAVERADGEDAVVALDYGREQLYIVDPEGVQYRPPTALGLAEAPGLQVRAPRTYDPGNGTVSSPGESRTISPEFDVLVPAFDREAPDEEWEPPAFEYRDEPAVGPSGAVGG